MKIKGFLVVLGSIIAAGCSSANVELGTVDSVGLDTESETLVAVKISGVNRKFIDWEQTEWRASVVADRGCRQKNFQGVKEYIAKRCIETTGGPEGCEIDSQSGVPNTSLVDTQACINKSNQCLAEVHLYKCF